MVGEPAPYSPERKARLSQPIVRGVRYGIREWGPVTGKPILFLHGARDSSVSFQFIADEFDDAWRIIAPDWRGHGRTQMTPGSYWTSDFLCDLDALFEQLIPMGRAPILGHSMGGNVASVFAGLRPDAVSHLMTLDVLGSPLPWSPVRVVETLTDLLNAERRGATRRRYATIGEMADRLIQANPRLDRARALFIAEGNAVALDGGSYAWPHDPTFLRSWPTLHSVEEWAECWRKITAPVVSILASDPRASSPTSDPKIVAARCRNFRNITVRRAPDTGHNVHQDAPQFVAQCLKDFLRDAA